MNRDDIIRMALDAGADFLEARTGDCFIFDAENGALERFAVLVAAAEREACIDIAEQHATIEGIAQKIIADIRARGQ